MSAKTAEEFATEVADTFKMRPRRHGREWRVPCPVHEADGHHNPSMACWDGPSRVFFKCMTGCPQAAVKAALKARGVAVPGAAIMSAKEQHAAAVAKEAQRVEALRKAFEVLDAAQPVTPEDAVGRYLSSRYLTAPEGRNTVYCSDDPVGAGAFAMAAPIVDLSTVTHEHSRVVGIATLSLRENGTPLMVAGKKLRSVAGNPKGNGVPLGRPTRTIIVGEGIESVLAARVLIAPYFGIACLSALNMAALAPPEWVEEIIVVADNDDAGQTAAKNLKAEMLPLGVRVEVVTYGGGRGYDAADHLKALRETK